MDDTDMRPDYNFSGATRGRYAERFARGTNLVAIAPDLVEAFPDSAAVNAALRRLLKRSSQRGKLVRHDSRETRPAANRGP